MLVLLVSGCGDALVREGGAKNVNENGEMQNDTRNSGAGLDSESDGKPDPETEKIIKLCQEFYEKAAEEDELDDLEVIRDIVESLGEHGYAVVDSKNQVNMTEAEQVIRFCENVEKKAESTLTVIEVTDSGGFIKFDLQTQERTVDVARAFYCLENDTMKKMSAVEYEASEWQYTKDGYLLFSGAWFSEESYMFTMSNAKEQVALRVLPLDDKCRELNRNYLLPISYERNNMFLVDWSEKDYGELDFYDLYDALYPMVNGEPLPYEVADNLDGGTIYQIPKAEFEKVIMAYFQIDSETLQSKTVYDAEIETYEYRPRGRYEAEFPEYPYSEVTAYTENEDGTVTLTVDAVFPAAGVSKVYTHEVVVRPFEGGKVQYVSNRVIHSEEDVEKTWHTPRLTGEERQRLFSMNDNLEISDELMY